MGTTTNENITTAQITKFRQLYMGGLKPETIALKMQIPIHHVIKMQKAFDTHQKDSEKRVISKKQAAAIQEMRNIEKQLFDKLEKGQTDRGLIAVYSTFCVLK